MAAWTCPSWNFLISVQMFYYSLDPFSNIVTCKKWFLFAALEAKFSELETWLHTLKNPVASQTHIVSTGEGSLASITSPSTDCSEQPGNQTGWVTVRRKFSLNRTRQPIMCLIVFPHLVTHLPRNKLWLLVILFWDTSNNSELSYRGKNKQH